MTFNSVLLILEWPRQALGLGSGQVEGLPGKQMVKGVRDTASLTPEAQQPSGSNSNGRPEPMLHRAHVCFPSPFCEKTLQHY